MTPLHIELLIWSHTRPRPFSCWEAPAVQEYADGMCREGVLHVVEQFDGIPSRWELTEKGRVWLEMILSTPMPVQTWTDPREAVKA